MGQERCPNCDAPDAGAYCRTCGQKQGELRPTVRVWLSETLDELFFVNARLPRTLRALVWPVGYLTAEYVKGRRAGYMSPLRLYLLVAVPFFWVFATPSVTDEPGSILQFVVVMPVLYQATERLDPMAPLSMGAAADSSARAAWQAEYARRRAFNDSASRLRDRMAETGVRRVYGLLPMGVGLFMVPLLALILGWRGQPPLRLIGRLVFSLHAGTVAYACALIGTVSGSAMVMGFVGAGAYLVLGRRRVFAERKADSVKLAVLFIAFYGVAFLYLVIAAVQLTAAVAPQWLYGRP